MLGLPGVTLASDTQFEVLPTEVRGVAVRVQVPPGMTSGSYPIDFEVRAASDVNLQVRERTTFLVPR